MAVVRHMLGVTISVVLAAPLAAQTTVPVSAEPRHHFRLANDDVRVYDVVVPRGDTTFYHVHAVDYMYVVFGPATLVAQTLGSAPMPLVLHDAEARFARGPLTHRVSNPGPAAFHNLTVELLKPADSSASHPAPLSADSIVLENDRVRVVRREIGAGKVLAVGSEGRALDVYVTAGVIEESLGARRERVRVEPAVFRWHGPRAKRSLRNLGPETVVVLTAYIK
jgi:hypothetical protein